MDEPPREGFVWSDNWSIESFFSLGFISVVLAMAIIFTFHTIYNTLRKKRGATGGVMVENTLCNIEDDIEDNIENGDTPENNCEDIITIYTHPMMPDWLKLRKDIIFLQSCIEKGPIIGRGQFGVVLKGQLTLGNAVYVF